MGNSTSGVQEAKGLNEHWKTIKLNAKLSDFNHESARKTMNEGLSVRGLIKMILIDCRDVFRTLSEI